MHHPHKHAQPRPHTSKQRHPPIKQHNMNTNGTNKKTGEQTDGPTKKTANKQTSKQSNVQANKQTHKHTRTQTRAEQRTRKTHTCKQKQRIQTRNSQGVNLNFVPGVSRTPRVSKGAVPRTSQLALPQFYSSTCI